ncbi:hypothetical protein PVAP13_1NG286738 [Panicum virgatum]|uniref:Uncharacterized protein n=1 Tax=Panicum virgatum TaxID=38727 RepID=A0A8T0WZL2_PANVG|nr:hypothetical protein PVAP13_1NG286738 [Panicum virgatum]
MQTKLDKSSEITTNMMLLQSNMMLLQSNMVYLIRKKWKWKAWNTKAKLLLFSKCMESWRTFEPAVLWLTKLTQ